MLEFLTYTLKNKLHIFPEDGQKLRSNLSFKRNIKSGVQQIGVTFSFKILLRLCHNMPGITVII